LRSWQKRNKVGRHSNNPSNSIVSSFTDRMRNGIAAQHLPLNKRDLVAVGILNYSDLDAI
jgi:hypothetical protein